MTKPSSMRSRDTSSGTRAARAARTSNSPKSPTSLGCCQTPAEVRATNAAESATTSAATSDMARSGDSSPPSSTNPRSSMAWRCTAVSRSPWRTMFCPATKTMVDSVTAWRASRRAAWVAASSRKLLACNESCTTSATADSAGTRTSSGSSTRGRGRVTSSVRTSPISVDLMPRSRYSSAMSTASWRTTGKKGVSPSVIRSVSSLTRSTRVAMV